MSDTITLSADVRETGKKLQTLRKEGLVPAVLYGHGVEPQSIMLDHLRFARAFREAGENTLIALSIGGGKSVNVLIKDTQKHPTTNRYTHADFFQVRMDEVIETAVPITFVGESPAVRELGGILIRAIDEIDVSALPADLPHTIEADLSKLATFDDVIKVSDLPVSSKVEILHDMDSVVALVEPPRTEAELAALDEKVEVDVTKVEGAEKPAEKAEGASEESSK